MTKGFDQLFVYEARGETVAGLKDGIHQMGDTAELWNRFVKIERETGRKVRQPPAESVRL